MKRELPIEYEKGSVKFLNCKIDLSKRVFIPRIETELWVKRAIKDIKQRTTNSEQKIRALDIFAGSGCIGIALLKNIKNSFVDFVDIDKNAIEQIKINLKLNKISPARYNIYQSNLFEEVGVQKYNFIFANPPYAAIERVGEIDLLVKKYEPKKAYLAGKGGMDHMNRFFIQAKSFLTKTGIIYLEFDPLQKEEIRKILISQGFKNPKFFKDQFNKYRWVKVDNFK